MGNFLDMQKAVQTYVSDRSSGTLELIKNEINQQVSTFINSGYWSFALRQATITTTAGLADYYLINDAERIISMTQNEDKIALSPIWVGDFEKLVPDVTGQNGHPQYYMELLNDKVFAQPTTTSKVTVVSDSNSDLTQKIGIYGVSGGVERNETLSLSAQNFVSSVNTYSKIYAINVDLSCAGNIAAYEATVGTPLASIYSGETEREYKKFKLYPTPDGTYTIYITYQFRHPKLINDSDIIMLPNKCMSAIQNMVVAEILLKQGDTKWQVYDLKAKADIKDMLQAEELNWDLTPRLYLMNNTPPRLWWNNSGGIF